MLQRFAALDGKQSPPSRVQLVPMPVDVLGHRLTMGVDLVYDSEAGSRLLLLITDREIRRTEHLRLYATAAALHFEGRPDGSPVERVDVWILVANPVVVGRPRSLLERTIPSVAIRLDEIARGIESQAA